MSDTQVTTKQPGSGLGAQRIMARNRGIGPVGHLADERARLDQRQWRHFTVRRMGATIGAELHGVDLSQPLGDEVIDEIRQALHDFKVIFFRDQQLTAEQHVAFARRFGELEIHPFIPGNTTVPELVRFEKSAETGGYENTWHHDVTWRECPSMGAILRAVHVPDAGGDTLFSDMYAAYEGLDDETKAQIDELDATNDFLRAFGVGLDEEKRREMRERYPIMTHPIVARHPATGRKHLYVNGIFTTGVVGPDGPWDPQHSEELLQRLFAQAETVEYQCRFHWEPNSIAFWDNRAVQHYAASDYWPQVRVMERASIVGPRPSR